MISQFWPRIHQKQKPTNYPTCSSNLQHFLTKQSTKSILKFYCSQPIFPVNSPFPLWLIQLWLDLPGFVWIQTVFNLYPRGFFAAHYYAVSMGHFGFTGFSFYGWLYWNLHFFLCHGNKARFRRFGIVFSRVRFRLRCFVGSRLFFFSWCSRGLFFIGSCLGVKLGRRGVVILKADCLLCFFFGKDFCLMILIISFRLVILWCRCLVKA